MKFSFLHYSLFVWVVAGFASTVWAGPIREGNRLYEQGDYSAALEHYLSARATEKDSNRVRFNVGTALYKNGKFAESVQELAPLIGGADSSLAANAAYNSANARFRMGESLQGGERIAAWREALALLKRSLDFNPEHEPAKKNAEIMARRLKLEVAQQQNQKQEGEDGKQPPLSEFAKKARDKALELSRQGRYTEALSVLEKALEAEPEARALNPYIQRIQDVIDIRAGKKPEKMPDASNALNELEVI